MPIDRLDSRIGPLNFHSDFSDPYVDVDREMRTVEHETINDEFVVQVLGRTPDKFTVEGVIYDNQLREADRLLGAGEVTVRTNEWQGTAVATNVDTSFRREADPETGRWVYDVTVNLVEVERFAINFPAHPDSGANAGPGEGFIEDRG